MATKLNDFAFDPANKVGRPRTYPWDTWDDGSIWQITAGEDFQVSIEQMQRNLRNRACYLDKRVRISRNTPAGTLTFQFYK